MLLNILIDAFLMTGIILALEYIYSEERSKQIHKKLCSILKDEFDVCIHLNYDKKTMNFADKNYKKLLSVSYKDVIIWEQAIINALQKYSQKALEELPKDYVIVYQMFEKETNSNILAEAIYDKKLIVLNSKSNFETLEKAEGVIHHELFHILSWNWTDEYKEFSAVDNNLINEDYKDEVDEEAADNWAYGFFHKYNAKSNYLHNKYSYWLNC